MNLYKKSTAKPYSFLVSRTILPSHNLLRFIKNLAEKNIKLIMKSDDKVKDEMLHYDIIIICILISLLIKGKNVGDKSFSYFDNTFLER